MLGSRFIAVLLGVSFLVLPTILFGEDTKSSAIEARRSGSGGGRGDGSGRRRTAGESKSAKREPLVIWADRYFEPAMSLFSSFYADNFPVEVHTRFGDAKTMAGEIKNDASKVDLFFSRESDLSGVTEYPAEKLLADELVAMAVTRGAVQERSATEIFTDRSTSAVLVLDRRSANSSANLLRTHAKQQGLVENKIVAIKDFDSLTSRLKSEPGAVAFLYRSEIPDERGASRSLQIASLKTPITVPYFVRVLKGPGDPKVAKHYLNFLRSSIGGKVVGSRGLEVVGGAG